MSASKDSDGRRQLASFPTAASSKMSENCSVRVVCRVRPLNEKERVEGNTVVVGFPPGSHQHITLQVTAVGDRS